MARIVFAKSSAEVLVPDGESIAIFSQDSAQVSQKSGPSNIPLGTVTANQQTFGPFAGDATVVIEAGEYSAHYAIGVVPVIREFLENRIQREPTVMNASGNILIAAMFGGVITSSSTLGVTGALPTGAAVDASGEFRPDDSFEWSIITNGLGGNFTVAGSAGHTIVGSGTVNALSSAIFRTRKTATNTFVSYRIG